MPVNGRPPRFFSATTRTKVTKTEVVQRFHQGKLAQKRANRVNVRCRVWLYNAAHPSVDWGV